MRQDTSPVPSQSTTALSAWGPTSGSRQVDSPKRPAEEWERQIETLDQKENELQRTQLRLIREQTATFRGDLLALRQEVSDLKANFSKHVGVRGDIGAKVEGRLQELADCISNHAQLHQEVDRKMAQLNESFQSHHLAFQHAGTMKDRIDYLEKFIGDSGEQSQRQLEEAHSKVEQVHAKLEQMHGRLLGQEQGHGELKRGYADNEAKHATLAERVGFLERLTGDSAERHMQQMDTLRTAHEWQAKDQQARHGAVEQIHASLTARLNFVEAALGASGGDELGKAPSNVCERVAYLEKCVGDSAEKHQADMGGLRTHIDRMGDHAAQLDLLKKGHMEAQKSMQDFHQHHSVQDERIKYIEKVLCDSVEKQSQEIESIKVAHGRLQSESRSHHQNHSAAADKMEAIAKNHSSVEERLSYMERVLGDAAEKHSKEISTLKAAHGTHAQGVREVQSKHIAVQDRIEYLEKALGDSAEKHNNAAAMQQAKIEQLHSKLTEQERESLKHTGELSATKDKLAQSHATIEDRLAYIEKAVGESFESYARELENMKGKHSQLDGDRRDVKAKHASMEDRLGYIESWFRGFKGPEPAVGSSASAGLRARSPIVG